jgi:betaine-aldehyde dehydrogenase
MAENGKVLAECRAQVASAAAIFRYYAAVCETTPGAVTPSRGPYVSITIHEPMGVVAAVTPWNSPLTMEAQKVAPALAAGNSVIVKPSEVTPGVALQLGRILLEAGVPPGVVNVIPGDGAETGLALVRHPGVGMISFTGGTETGRRIGVIAAERGVPVSLELGGKSPNIVFADADLERAVEGVAGAIFGSTGQSCIAGSRLLVEASVYGEVMERLIAKARAIRFGDPADPASQIGPIASFAHRERIERFVVAGAAEGGRIVCGGERPGGALACGAYYPPTILTELTAGSSVVRSEIFGPVLAAMPFRDEAELIALANGTPFGLACGIWTADYQRAWRVARAIDAGTVWINTYKQLSISTPFGGFKASGIGREKGIEGMRLYQQAKSLYWGLDDADELTS